MQFLYPSFLWALLTLAIPIIIHLFHFRRFKKVYFTNVRFLREVKQENSARSRLKHLLVLLARCLALAGLVIAFAQPILPKSNDPVTLGSRAVSVYIDNSFSMSSLSQDVPLIELAKERARQIVSAYRSDDEFQILTNAFAGRELRLVSQEDALAMIDDIDIQPAVQTVAAVVERQRQILRVAAAAKREAYLITDFQTGMATFPTEADTTLSTYLVPLQSVQQRNISIDTCWFEAPMPMLNQTNRLIVQLTNHSDAPATSVPLSLRLYDQVKPIGNFDLDAQATVSDTVNITLLETGLHRAALTISDFPITFDDAYYFAFEVAPSINILSIHDLSPNRNIAAVYDGNPYFAHTQQPVSNVDYASFNGYQLIILSELSALSSGLTQELKQFVNQGGQVLLLPSARADLNSYAAFMQAFQVAPWRRLDKRVRQVSQINTNNWVFQDVYLRNDANLKLPTSQQNFVGPSSSLAQQEVLLTYRDGSAFLSQYSREQGSLYVCTAPIDAASSDLVQNAEIFVPMLYKIAIAGSGRAPLAYTIGKDELLEAKATVERDEIVFKLTSETAAFIPQQRTVGAKVILGVGDQVESAGYYDLRLGEGDDTPLATFAFNYDRSESAQTFVGASELRNQAPAGMEVVATPPNADFSTVVGNRSRGRALWMYFLVAALAFLAIETGLLRLWKGV